MNNPTIDGVSREFEEWWANTPILRENKRTIAEKAWSAALAAPVVERQADAWLDEESGALATADLKGFMVGVAGFEIPLFRAPPQLAELQADRDSLRETFDNLIVKLGIDRATAQKEPGKPSDVFAKYVNELQATIERQTALLRRSSAFTHDLLNPISLRRDINACLDATAAMNKP